MTLDIIETVGQYNHLQIRYLKEDGTYHREIIICGDFEKASELGIDGNLYWTSEMVNEHKESIRVINLNNNN